MEINEYHGRVVFTLNYSMRRGIFSCLSSQIQPEVGETCFKSGAEIAVGTVSAPLDR